MKPRIGISRCLVGDDVRYDGTNKRSHAVGELSPYVEWVSICPEVEVGMGVPREPIRLVADENGVRSAEHRVRVLGVHSGSDWTDRMDRWTKQRVAQLVAEQISGFVLKARSPSCGPSGVVVHHADATSAAGRGLFAEALAAAMPALPMIDEEALADAYARERFMLAVREYEARHPPRAARSAG